MLFLLSPAKSLDFESPLPDLAHTAPLFVAQSAKLIGLMRKKSAAQVAGMMDISDKLAKLNVARYKAWRRKFATATTRQAILAFNGDVYGGLNGRSLNPDQLAWAQDHVCILSGLYGVLRPLDLMQPYRLEMSMPVASDRGSNLYQFWGSRISEYLNQRLTADKTPVVVNLASQEYFKSVDLKALRARVVECVFEEERDGHYKIISFSAKRARGLMARYAIDHGITSPKNLEGFNVEGY
ncbi:MAG: peroxide stress protein YaaA, partial [Rhizobiales bacterium]|nr:peroxide stress protein YaaA [Hyphomicrobiales bacterium]